jgi:hypothetical protein
MAYICSGGLPPQVPDERLNPLRVPGHLRGRRPGLLDQRLDRLFRVGVGLRVVGPLREVPQAEGERGTVLVFEPEQVVVGRVGGEEGLEQVGRHLVLAFEVRVAEGAKEVHCLLVGRRGGRGLFRRGWPAGG